MMYPMRRCHHLASGEETVHLPILMSPDGGVTGTLALMCSKHCVPILIGDLLLGAQLIRTIQTGGKA